MANIVSVDDFITDEWYPGFSMVTQLGAGSQ